MKIHEAIALEHVATMLKLVNMWRFDVSCVDQALCACSLSGLVVKKTSLKIGVQIVDHLALYICIRSWLRLLICWNVFQQV